MRTIAASAPALLSAVIQIILDTAMGRSEPKVATVLYRR